MPKNRPVQPCKRCKKSPVNCDCLEFYIRECEFEPMAWNGDSRVEIRQGFLNNPEVVITLGDLGKPGEVEELIAPAIEWRNALVRHRGPNPHFDSHHKIRIHMWSKANDPGFARKMGLRKRPSYTVIARAENRNIERNLRTWVGGGRTVAPGDLIEPEGCYEGAVRMMRDYGLSSDKARAAADEAAELIRTKEPWPDQWPISRDHVINTLKAHRRHFPGK